MARPAITTPADLAPLLRSRAPLSATEMADSLGVHRATVVRTLADFGAELVSMGETRRTRYALRREIRGAGNHWAIHRIDETGRAQEWARLEAMHDRLWRIVWAGEVPEWAAHFSNREGLWEGFPFFLSDVRPQGYLGRAITRRLSRTLQVPEDPRRWSDEDIVVFLQAEGGDLPGDLVVGDAGLRRALAGILDAETETEQRYPELAGQSASGLPGTSAGGEQPKFLTCVERPEGTRRDVLVKFSPPMDQQTGRRWADLLLGEFHAHAVLERVGLALAGARILDAAGRRFLEIPRFDRTAAGGRRGVVSLEALHAAAIGSHAREWTEAMAELERAGLVGDEAVAVARRTQAFGELIGNTDMHFGNLSFWLNDRLPFRVAPTFDMLPMLWAPGASGELMERRFEPAPPVPAMRDAWREAAGWAEEFWRNLAADERLSDEFAAFARDALGKVARLREFVG
jgi:hypothetical protein